MKNILFYTLFIYLYFFNINEIQAKNNSTIAIADSCIEIIFTNGQRLSVKVTNITKDSISYVPCGGDRILKTIDKKRLRKINISPKYVQNQSPNTLTQTLIIILLILTAVVAVFFLYFIFVLF